MSGFQVESRPYLGHGFERDDYWSVCLWDDRSGKGSWWVTDFDVPHADAVKEMERFVADAQEALDALKERRRASHEDPEMVAALRELPSSADLHYQPGVVRELVRAYRRASGHDDWEVGVRDGLVEALGIVLGLDEAATIAWLRGLPE